MTFTPENYSIPDIAGKAFIDHAELLALLKPSISDKKKVQDIVQKSLEKNRLSLTETATLIHATDPESVEIIKNGAAQLKENVYGNRIVLFAPLYVGNRCVNNCLYCGFKASNKQALRKTLSEDELTGEVEALLDSGQKRLILVFGEHHEYDASFIANAVRKVYSIKKGNGEIRRVNINAAPQSVEGFRMVKDAGIGTYQIFQETYHEESYRHYHPTGNKSNYENRLISLDNAMTAGIDDVGIGALLGLYDWRYELLGLIRHTNHLEACFNVGPHTISFPRLQQASSMNHESKWMVNDTDFTKMVSILRLAVPYTGLILTARENAALRNELIKYGVSQIDGGTKIELGAYANTGKVEQNLDKEQFRINDNRSLNEIIDELLNRDQLPSFCTACYRLGRTGEHFMEFSVPGFIKRFCSPNAIFTLAEYLLDYAPKDTADKGWKVIEHNLDMLEKHQNVSTIREKLELMKKGERDVYF